MAKGSKTKKVAALPLEQTDGRADHNSAPNLKQKRTLNELMGYESKSRYSQSTVEEYKEFLKGMNLTDMHREAQARGLIPISDRRVLEQRLTREFSKTSSKYFGTVVQGPQAELSPQAAAILAAGR